MSPKSPVIADVETAVSNVEAAFSQDLEHLAREGIDTSEIEADTSISLTVVDSEYQQPWDRLADEPAGAYKHFLAYRDMGLVRTMTQVATDTGTKQPTISREAKKYDWRHRIEAWDAHEDHLYQLARGEALREMGERHAEKLGAAIEGLSAPVTALVERIESDPTFMEQLSETSVALLLDLAGKSARLLPNLMRAENLARGMPTEIHAGTLEVNHTFSMNRDQLGEVLNALDEAGALDGRGFGGDPDEIVEAEVVDVHPVPADDNN